MGTSHRRTAVTASITLSAMALAACVGGGGDADAGDGDEHAGELIYLEGSEFPENLFPAIGQGNSPAVANILIRILPSPFRVLPDYAIAVDGDLIVGQPTLERTDTGQVVTYEVNPDAVWSDGTEVSAVDFEFTWDLQNSSDPADGGCPALLGTFGYDQIESVEGTEDGKTVTVTYGSPYPDWKSLFTLFPAHIMDTGDPVSNCEAATTGWPIAQGIPEDFSGGPWQLLAENIDTGSQVVTLTPNPRWYGDGPLLERLVHQSIEEPRVAVDALQSGEVDLVSPPLLVDLVSEVQALEPNVETEIAFGLAFEHFDLNTANPHLAKPEVRRAFGLALDRAAIASATMGVFDDRAQPMNNRFYVNNQPEYVDTAPEQYKTQDIDGAIALLESVGYTIGTDRIAVHPTDGRLELTMSTLQNEPLFEDTIDLASAQVAEAGFAIEKLLDPDIFAGPDRPTSLESRGFDIALFAWINSPYVSGNIALYRTGASQNFAGVSNAEVDALLDQLSVELDPAVAAGLANDADRILWEEMVTIPLFQRPTFTAWSSEFENIVPNATNAGPLWNSDEISLAG